MTTTHHRRTGVRPACTLLLIALAFSPRVLMAQPPEASRQAAPQETPPSEAERPARDSEEPQRFFDSVTVSATLNPTAVKDTPGTVSVIDAATIARRMIENAADLVVFEPGVYVESNLTRVGLNGFNIRGIGGNRVMTQVDGVETSEQFDFGPFNVHQFGLDLDTLKSAEIVRGAGSSLYGSDALGGVVSFFTKDPADYLGSRRYHLGAKAMFDGRSENGSGSFVLAGGSRRVQGSAFLSYDRGHESRNRGSVRSQDATRTALNPQDRRGFQGLGKLTFTNGAGNLLRATVEVADNEIDTEAYSLRVVTAAGPTVTNVADIDSIDTMRRWRASLDQEITDWAGLNVVSWNAYVQRTDTGQVVDELRVTTGAGPAQTMNRSATLDYEQDTYGVGLQARKALVAGGHSLLLSFGGNARRDTFDMIRDRLDIDAATGAVIPVTNLILPTKYFPKSDVSQVAGYLQGEVRLGRVTLVPGLRYDRFSLDADSDDTVFIASLSPAAADFSAGAVSARLGASVGISDGLTLHGQYSGGFRAPPYSAVNSGFTNLLGGYTSVPNTSLEPETSDNFEIGFRSALGPVSLGVTGFWNAYDDFILQVQRGLNPTTRLLEFQYQNVSEVEIRGLEFRGEARLGELLRLRAAYARIRGEDVSGTEDVPLDSIAPNQGIVGLQYSNRSNRWGSELTVRAAHGQPQRVAGPGLFAPSAFAVADVTGWLALPGKVTLRAAVLNLTDAKYFEWPNVRGRQAADPLIDRYSSPGVSGLVSVAYGW